MVESGKSRFHELLFELQTQYEHDVDLLHAEAAKPQEELPLVGGLLPSTVSFGWLPAAAEPNPLRPLADEKWPLADEKLSPSRLLMKQLPGFALDDGPLCFPGEEAPRGDHQHEPRSKVSFDAVSKERRPSENGCSSAGKVSQASQVFNGFELNVEWTKKQAKNIFSGKMDEDKIGHHTRMLLKKTGTSYDLADVSARVSEITKKYFCMLDPGSDVRMWWDIAGMVLICWDLITVPLLVFDPPATVLTTGMDWTTLLFWTADIGWSVSTGYFSNGKLVMKRSSIIMRYIRTWFAIDLVVVLPDWIMTFIGSTSSLSKLGRLFKVARVLRVLRLLRLLKLRRLVNEMYDRIASELMFIIVELVKLLVFILVLNHLVACGWYGVGAIGMATNANLNWLQDVGLTPVYNKDLAWKYTTSLHWSITQFTPASMDIYAVNTGERVFSVFILFWALVALSSIISSVSAAMTTIRNMSGDRQKQFWLLRRYLTQRSVSKELYKRIGKYVEFLQQSKMNILPLGKVTLLTQLSESLKSQLSYEIDAPLLQLHAFCEVLNAQVPTMMYRLCSVALKTCEYAKDDVPFFESEEAISMFFVKIGSFRYRSFAMLARGTFVSEAALWTSWMHRGDLTAVSEVGELVAVLSEAFGRLLRSHPKAWNLALRYGTDYVIYMNSIDPSHLSDVMVSADDENGEARTSGFSYGWAANLSDKEMNGGVDREESFSEVVSESSP